MNISTSSDDIDELPVNAYDKAKLLKQANLESKRKITWNNEVAATINICLKLYDQAMQELAK